MKSNTFAPINGHEVEFYVNEEKGTVCALIKQCGYDPQRYVLKMRGKQSYDRMVGYVSCMSYEYKALARCCAPDVFDEQTGKEIAYVKLQGKYWHHLWKRLDRAYERMKQDIKELDGMLMEACSIADHHYDEYYEVCKEVDKDKQEVSPDYGG